MKVKKPILNPSLREGLEERQMPPGENLQDIGKRIDVNAIEIETYWQDVTCCFASDEFYLVCAVV